MAGLVEALTVFMPPGANRLQCSRKGNMKFVRRERINGWTVVFAGCAVAKP
jgi:hypothetical protein